MTNIEEILKKYHPNETMFYSQLNKELDSYYRISDSRRKKISFKIIIMHLLMIKMMKNKKKPIADIENSLSHIKYLFYEDYILTSKEYREILYDLDDNQIVNILKLIARKLTKYENPDHEDRSSSPVSKYSEIQDESYSPEIFEAFGNLEVSKLFEEDILIKKNMYNLKKLLIS